VRRHREGTEELAELEAEIERVTEERERIPNLAYRAGMDERYQEEDELKARYKNLGQALDSLNERRGSLEDELRRLASSGSGESHPMDVQIERYAEAAGVAHARRLELEALKKRLTEALDTHLDPVIESHTDQKARVEALSRDRAWDQSPVGRGGIRI
jgi:DNA repair exonuclease SbcCD ATPase subunit